MKNFRKLEVWQDGISLVSIIYQISKYFPKDEQYGITAQIRRAAVSIPSNIAESCRSSHKEMARFLSIALGSTYELETQLIISCNLKYMTKADQDKLVAMTISIQKRLTRYIQKLNTT